MSRRRISFEAERLHDQVMIRGYVAAVGIIAAVLFMTWGA